MGLQSLVLDDTVETLQTYQEALSCKNCLPGMGDGPVVKAFDPSLDSLEPRQILCGHGSCLQFQPWKEEIEIPRTSWVLRVATSVDSGID